MKPKRSKFDWGLEALALLAVLGIVFLLATEYEHLPAMRPTRFRFPGAPQRWDLRTSLGVMGALGVFGYVGMTIATHYEKLIQIPEQLNRAAPHMRQMVFSMGILLKTVLMLVSLYLVWALVNAAQGRLVGLDRRYFTGLVLLVLAPFALYITRMWRRGRR